MSRGEGERCHGQELWEALSVFLRPQRCFTFRFVCAKVGGVDGAAASAVEAYSVAAKVKASDLPCSPPPLLTLRPWALAFTGPQLYRTNCIVTTVDNCIFRAPGL
jgi:hypothetical protein